MSLMEWLTSERRSTLANPDKLLLDGLGMRHAKSGATVNQKTSLAVSGFSRAITLLAKGVGKIPLDVYKRDGGGKERDPRHPAYPLLKYESSGEMTAYTVKTTLTAHAVQLGNGYAWIRRNGISDPLELVPLNPESTYPVRENGKLWYVVDVNGQRRKEKPENILHIKGLGFDGLCGYSVLEMAMETLGLALAQKEYQAVYFKNNARPSVTLEHPGKLSPEARKNLREEWADMHSGLENSHKPALLQEGMKVNPFSISAKDSELIAGMKFNLVDISNFTGVPVHKIGGEGRTAYASLEQENQSHLDDGLDPWLVEWESECRRRLLREREKENDTHVIEFNRRAFVRADIVARYTAYGKGIVDGWLSREEVRDAENMNPADPELKKFLQPLNMQVVGEPPPAKPVEPPAQEQEPDPDEPTDIEGDETNGERMRRITAIQREQLRESLGRMIRRLGIQARKAAKFPKEIDAWLESIEAEHAETLREMSRNQLAGMAELTGKQANAADSLIAMVRGTVNQLAETCGADKFAEQVALAFDMIEAEWPASFITESYGDEN